MAVRKPLQRLLLKAWKNAIDLDYCNQRINSERSLQASFWAQLNQTLSARSHRMFIEPRFTVKLKRQRKVFYPDIVICNSQKVIAVIEMKYQPRVSPSYDKDLKTLSTIAENRKQLRVSNARFFGPTADAKEYTLSDKILFVWAGVHKTLKKSFNSKNEPMFSKDIEELSGCFLQLHAETNQLDKPNVFVREC